MQSWRMAIFLCGALLAASVGAGAQGVYVTPGSGGRGPVFSDKPQAGAKEVQLPPLSVVPAVVPAAPSPGRLPAAGPVPGAAPPEAFAGYRRLLILFPENNGSVVANTGVFDVRLAVDPPLRVGEGHAFVVRINGQPIGQRFTATELMVPAEFWGGAMPPINQPAQIDASIVDAAGQVLMTAPPTVFFMRYTTVLQRPHPLSPPLAPGAPYEPYPVYVPVRPRAPPYGQAPAPPASPPARDPHTNPVGPGGAIQNKIEMRR